MLHVGLVVGLRHGKHTNTPPWHGVVCDRGCVIVRRTPGRGRTTRRLTSVGGWRRRAGSYVTHETKHFIYFYLGQVAVLLFKSG